MVLEYALLLSFFTMTMLGVLMKVPKDAFVDSGPKLAARVEKYISTGTGFDIAKSSGQIYAPKAIKK